MTARRLLFGAVTILAALLVQQTLLARLPLPGAAPDLLLVLVVGFALAEGPLSGAVTGFVAGLLADLVGAGELGRIALVLTLVGYVAGSYAPQARSSLLLAFGVVAAAAAAASTVYAAEGLLLADPRITLSAWTGSLASGVPYAAALTPFVVPAVDRRLRRLDRDPLSRL